MYRLFLSLRYLRARRTNWIGVAGIFVAVTALILILSIMSGFLGEARSHLRGNLADMIIAPRLDLLHSGGGLVPTDPEPMLEIVRGEERVEAACLQLQWYGMLAPEGRSHIVEHPVAGNIALVSLVGIDVEQEFATTDFKQNLERAPHPQLGFTDRVDRVDDPFAAPAGYEPDGAPKPSIILGAQLSRAWGFYKGSEVEIVTAAIDPATGAVGDPINRRFVVAGTFRTGENEMDMERIYMEREVLADLLGREAPWSHVLVRLADYERDRHVVKANLLERLQDAGYLHDPLVHPVYEYEIQTWEDFRSNLLGAIENEKALMGVMLSLVMVVAGFTVFAILSMMVSQKRRDIGILCALGATPRGILTLFLLMGCWEALMGATFGTLAGIWGALRIDPIERWLSATFGVEIFNREVYLFDHIPSVIHPGGVALIVLGAVVCTLVFAAIPAWQAARLDPIDALRYE